MELSMVVCVVAFVLCFTLVLIRWNDLRYRRKGLPPGTMGWPMFGETAEFLKLGPDFMKRQGAKHGKLFKTHIFGCPTVICMDTDLNRYILLNEAKGLVPGYPQSSLDILGKCNIAAVHGAAHKHIRGSLLSIVNPNMIKDRLFAKIDKAVRPFLANWDGKIVDIQEKMIEMAVLLSFKQLLDKEAQSVCQALRHEFNNLVLGTFSLPINFPGTNYYKGIQARKNVIKILRRIIDRRRASSETCNDMLDCLLNVKDPKYRLNDEEIIDQVITFFNSGYETFSTTSMMALKHLHDHPKVLQELREEHLAIQERKRPGELLDSNDYKSMTFTRAVILETLRLTTIVNGVMRKTTDDIEINGCIIPKGWRIYVYFREINYNPFLYLEPFDFNPWRWMDKKLESHNHVLLFGGGSRLWEEVGENKILKFPRVKAPNGLHMAISTNVVKSKHQNISAA
ncbi:Cytochrome P450 [Dillenia turbinata]|uniref:Cytochrome P450 n=1 Tax=Dillenia turbinata TaxID=194707 RepID=A0AAN8Z272_9MAGN